MKKIKAIVITLFLLLFAWSAVAQEKRTITGKILSDHNTPVSGAIVSIQGAQDVVASDDGTFSIEVESHIDEISFWAVGFYSVSQVINNRSELTVVMVPDDTYKYNESLVLPFRIEQTADRKTAATNISKENFKLGGLSIDQALAGQVAGLRVTPNGGMPGEGSYINLRGLRSFVGQNAPLIVINGVPHMPDDRESPLINGLTRNIFQGYNIMDIQNITVLKGAEASLYGSMGSNGVILIETDGAPSDDLETKISFYGQYGVNWNNKRMPLLNGADYKSYLSEVGLDYFDTMEAFFSAFPFLNAPDNIYYYLYKHDTDWQENLYRKSFVTDNLFRVEGGDAVAKYDLSLGYMLENGILESTKTQRYQTQLNTNVFISKDVELFATIGLAYLNGNYQEQGMTEQTNPVLAAYKQSPVLSPYGQDNDGNIMPTYRSYYYGRNTNMDFAASNPLAIIHTLDAYNRQYDVNIRAGLNFTVTPDLMLSGTIGLYYNYNYESLFIPGLTDMTIVPLNTPYGDAFNTVKKGIAETTNWFYQINGRYKKTFNRVHKLNALAGMQIFMTKNEYDAGVGYNTASDFYQTLGSSGVIGRHFHGYLEKWNWLNFYGHADYTHNDMVAASVNLGVDGASSQGKNANTFQAYPSVGITWLGKGWMPLSNSTWVNRFNVRAEYGLTGNSRFSSNYGKYHYTSNPFQMISGIVKSNISNTYLKPEKNTQLNVGLDVSLLYNRLDISLDYYNSQASNVIIDYPLSSIFGTAPYYSNSAKIENKGMELSVRGSLVRLPDFEWIVGGNIAANKNKLKSLGGGLDQIVFEIDDDVKMVSKVGESLYQFYGYKSEGVFKTDNDATQAGLINRYGREFQAGDIHFEDQNGDHRIDDKDRVHLGNASPRYFGGFYTQFQYKNFSLAAEFTYSKGNKAYNAVRRFLESGSTVGNQSVNMANRWSLEGQQTDVPRVQWGDPLGNSDFSSRWIEDASYFRMKNITLSYRFNRKVLNFIHSGTLYITAENLWTETKYLGLDPEFSYSNQDFIQGIDYAKVMQPKSIKFGLNLNF